MKSQRKLKLSYRNEAKAEKSIRTLIKKCCEAVLQAESFDKDAEVSVLLTNSEEVRALNLQYRAKDKTTDVLSFPLGEINPENGYFMPGDIVINTDIVSGRELPLMAVHSMLHLLGYDHEDDEGDKIMREKQTKILNGLGLDV
jgi:probable rRNA maturation factor